LRVILAPFGSDPLQKLSRAVLRGGGDGNVTSLSGAWVGNHPGLPGPATGRGCMSCAVMP
jgi:hypothetical protein